MSPDGFSRATAASTAARSSVGRCVTSADPPNATTAMRTDDGCFAMNDRAAAFAASSRDGNTSVAAMLFDTSNASTTVPSRCGSVTDATGRVSDSTMTAMAAMSSAGPTCRHRPRGGGSTRPCAASSCRRASAVRRARR